MTTLAAMCIVAAAAVANDWENPAVNSIDRLPARSYTVPLKAEADAFTDALEPKSPYVASLNGEWRFRWAGNPDLAPQDFWKPDFDDAKWDLLAVPSCVEMHGYGTVGYVNVRYPHSNTSNPSNANFAAILDRHTQKHDFNPVSSYRREFTVPAEWMGGRRVILRFEGVGSAFYVWVNGERAGYAEDSKLASEFDITKFLRPAGEKNVLAVRVYKWCDGSFVEDQDMFRYSGIFRDVSIWSCPKDGIWDFSAKTVVKAKDGICDSASLEIDGIDGEWNATIYDAAKNVVGKLDFKKPRYDFHIEMPCLWSAENPYLFTLVVRKGADIRMRRIGFKEQKVEGNTFYVNGRPIKLHGVNRHETSPYNGRTVSLEEMMRDITLMKRYNVDTVRTCHYPDHRLWYDLCDRYGIYVIAEADVEGHEPGYKQNGLGLFKEWEHTIVERNERNVVFFRNNTCVTFWSLGNETGHGPCFKAAIDSIGQLDPTRPVHWERGNVDADVDSVMYPSVEWLDERGRLANEQPGDDGARAKYKRLGNNHFPGKPLVMCEYAHAMGNAVGNLKEYWETVYSYPGLIGGCIWDWIDQAVWRSSGKIDPKSGLERKFLAYGGDSDERPNDGPFCCNGVIGAMREVTPKLLEVGHVYQGLHVVKEGEELKLVNRYGFTFADEFDCEWECVVEGVAVKKGAFKVPAVPPLSTGSLGFDWKAQLPEGGAKGETFFNFRFKTKKAADWAPKGWVAASDQVCIAPGAPRSFKADGGDEVVVEEDERTVTVGCGRTTAIFCRKTGTLCRLIMRGNEILCDPAPGIVAGPLLTCSRAFVDNDVWMREAFYLSGLTQLSYHPEPIEKVPNGIKVTTMVTGRKSAGFVHEATWTFSKDGSIDIASKVTPFGTMPVQIPRLGLSMRLGRTFGRMKYYGRGPWENYVDRLSGAFLGVWNSTVREQYVEYARPQDNGGKCDVRWAEFTDRAGRGVRFEASEPMFMQALHYEEQDLEWARHRAGEQRRNVPLQEQQEIFLRLDVRQLGLGGASCGTKPMDKYQFDPNEPVSWTMRISPVAGK